MLRKLIVGAVAVAGLWFASGEVQPAEASHRVRVYVGPRVTTVRWRGGRYRSVSPYYGGAYAPILQSGAVIGVNQPNYYSYPATVVPASGYVCPQSGVIYAQ